MTLRKRRLIFLRLPIGSVWVFGAGWPESFAANCDDGCAKKRCRHLRHLNARRPLKLGRTSFQLESLERRMSELLHCGQVMTKIRIEYSLMLPPLFQRLWR